MSECQTDSLIYIITEMKNFLEIKRQLLFFDEINLEITIFNYLHREYYEEVFKQTIIDVFIFILLNCIKSTNKVYQTRVFISIITFLPPKRFSEKDIFGLYIMISVNGKCNLLEVCF